MSITSQESIVVTETKTTPTAGSLQNVLKLGPTAHLKWSMLSDDLKTIESELIGWENVLSKNKTTQNTSDFLLIGKFLSICM